MYLAHAHSVHTPLYRVLLVKNKEAYEISLILIQGLLEYAFKILTVRSVQYFLPETFTVYFYTILITFNVSTSQTLLQPL